MCSATPSPRTSLSKLIDFQRLPYAHGGPTVTGIIRSTAADFLVAEELSFPLTGTGEHLYLRIRKTGQNTRWICKQLATTLNLPAHAVGYAGLKDRHAIADQWFSLHLPGKPDPGPGEIQIEGAEILESRRHAGKLRVGALSANRFRITVRHLAGDLAALDTALERLRTGSIPNYFGAQRFGRDGRNLTILTSPSSDRKPTRSERSFGLSALRSALFNGYVAERLHGGSWNHLLPGEIGFCVATGRYHHVDSAPETTASLRPTGLLWGTGQNQGTSAALKTEMDYFARFSDVTELLEGFDVRMMRRPLGLGPVDLTWTRKDNVLTVEFSLTRGQFATAVLREIVAFTDASL